MGLNAEALGLANRGVGAAGSTGIERLSPQYWELLLRANLRKFNPSSEEGSPEDPSPLTRGKPATEAQPLSWSPVYERKVTGGAVFGPPVAMKVGDQMLNLGSSKWTQEDMVWEGAAWGATAGAAAGVAFPRRKIWDSNIPKTETPIRRGILQQTASALYPILIFSATAVIVFALLYWISSSLVTRVVAPLQIQDYFFFSLRSFITFATVDTAPGTSLGRFLTSIEGLMGYITMLWFAIKVGQLTNRKDH